MERPLLIVGMHRSGTSALTGALQLLGVGLGNRLMPPKAGENDKGYFENLSVFEAHNALLQDLGHTWDDLRSLSGEDFAGAGVGRFQRQLGQILEQEFSASPYWAVKDPRLCRLLPVWLDLLHSQRVTPSAIVLYRDPEEVAQSLFARDGFSAEKSALLWLDHYLSAEEATRGVRRVFVSFSALLQDPVRVLRETAQSLETPWPRDPEALQPEIRNFISPKLRHHEASERPKDRQFKRFGRFNTQCRELSNILLKCAASPPSASDSADAFNEIRRSFNEAAQAVDPLLVSHMATLEAAAERRLAEVEERLLERLLEVHDRVNEGPRSHRARIHDLENITSERTAWLKMVSEQQSHLTNRLEETRQTQLEETERADYHALAIDELGRRVESYKYLSDTQDANIGDHLDQLAGRTQMLWQSKPWQLYGRFGGFKHNLFGKTGDLHTANGHANGNGTEVDEEVDETARLTLRDSLQLRWQEARERQLHYQRQKLAFLDRAMAISLPLASHPKVSIVIPVHNELDLTLQCLESIAETKTQLSFEVLVVDDASTDATRAVVSKVPSARLIRGWRNRGFLHTCNLGARKAHGEYLVFLNNDTIVTNYWLDHLRSSFDTFPEAGIVGSKLVYPDQVLAEAGSIIFKDGSGHNFGRSRDPSSPECNYARQVDYCSAAAIMIPRQLFLEVGSFDELFTPAYYEDVDLAFRVRQQGKRVYYQPRSEVIHLEGGSHGIDVTQGVKQYQVVNQESFVNRWKKVLDGHGETGTSPDTEKDRYFKGHLLVIDHRMPTPDQDAGSVRMIHVMNLVLELGLKVTFLPDNLAPHRPYMDELQASGVEVLTAPHISSLKEHLENSGELYDFVLISRVTVAEPHMEVLRELCPQARVIFDTVDLHYLRELRQSELDNDPVLHQSALATKEIELSVAGQSDITLVTSPHEQDILSRESPDTEVQVIPTIYESTPMRQPFEERRGVFFIGGFEHPPNCDAVEWFVEEILPLVHRTLPDLTFHIIGSKAPDSILALAAEKVKVVGWVRDPSDYFGSCRLSVAPIRFGAGVKGKVNHSLSHGIPCVATSLAAEGMFLQHNHDILIADEPQAFAKQVLRVYQDSDLWHRLSDAGRENVDRHFSLNAARGTVQRVFQPQQPASQLARR